MELSQLDAYQELQLLFPKSPRLCEELEKFRPPVSYKACDKQLLGLGLYVCRPIGCSQPNPALGKPSPVVLFNKLLAKKWPRDSSTSAVHISVVDLQLFVP
ncbi:hypothetical protein HU200_010550 [Digitaria exilis]|uniref:Uncharacterized protein n=1 Tax=Digitaria exilis TaxID=1010633 RepID=A0A835FHS4_9POAL|nr:hypothetical protein HU200_010550 [Digitaria exilis]